MAIDRISTEQRAELMAKIRRQNTIPERVVRTTAHRMGYRFRLHVAGLPGSPDLVFPSKHKVIFVHGCFWHRHTCKRGTLPTSNIEFWQKKLERNRSRDKAVVKALKRAGWRVMVVWECETRDLERLKRRISVFLSDAAGT